MTGNGDDVGDNNTSEHPWSVHFVVMTHMKYLTVLLQKQTNKTLLMELQSTEPGLWNQPKLEQDPGCVTKESNDLEKVLQPLWASVSPDKWEDFCPLCLLAAYNTTLQIHSKNKGWQSSSGTRTHSPHRQARVQGLAAGSWLAWT